MNVQLKSTNISLLFDYGADHTRDSSTNDLWQTLKRTAVEPGQSTSPDILSFADECLLCAQIATNESTSTGESDTEENNGTAHATHSEDHTPESPPSPFESSPPRVPDDRRIGFIYLHAGPANHPACEANIGVIVKESMRGRGYAREAVQLVLGWAFEDLKFHRVQVAILDTPIKDNALRLFIGSGFTHEGTKRRSVYQPEGEGMAGMWRDVTYLAMLDTEWTLQSTWRRNDRSQAVTLWDEMFSRHAREHEELLRWEEKHKRVKKSSSTETLKENVWNDIAYLTDGASSIGEPSRATSLAPSPRPNVIVTWDDDSEMEDLPDEDDLYDDWETAGETFEARRGDQEIGIGLSPPSPRDRMLSLASIPSTRRSEVMPQSPVTIPTSSTPGSSPPSSPSASSSIHSSWSDSEDEDDHTPNRVSALTLPVQLETPRGPFLRPRPASVRFRPRSGSASSATSYDSWSDAQSSIGTSSSAWDVISNTSEHSPRERLEA